MIFQKYRVLRTGTHNHVFTWHDNDLVAAVFKTHTPIMCAISQIQLQCDNNI